MKNLIVYIHPSKAFESEVFSRETDVLPKIQIENSLELGWKKKDILLVTNFPYEYMGVKALVVSDDNYNIHKRTATKINVILTLYEMGLINGTFWFHDLDAFQLEKITEEEVNELLNDYDLALTDYGKTKVNIHLDKRWSTGTLFFNERTEYIFKEWHKEIYNYKQNEEVVLLEMMKKGRNKQMRINRINVTYNFGTRKRNIFETYKIADKPIKVIHFHPFDDRPVDLGNDNMGVCIYGKSKVGKPLANKRLIRLFKKHNIL